ncbi:hypothetical protein DSCW_55930 [Desulfosarcina widdelii]|uniref:Uncharacterized protein n=1 Tax=Desulfosarcina widdelii TaxID=947919 RepID=A0A5K7Z8L2_9BACT|nr:hypothetical protein DSCW_55930 [Desulfosarcina widdelii]
MQAKLIRICFTCENLLYMNRSRKHERRKESLMQEKEKYRAEIDARLVQFGETLLELKTKKKTQGFGAAHPGSRYHGKQTQGGGRQGYGLGCL